MPVGVKGTRRWIDASGSWYDVEGPGRYQTIVETPADLARAAGVDVDTYSLARMVASEDFTATPAVYLALAETARNWARKTGRSVTTMLTHSSLSALRGRYGEQATRWASTRVDPEQRHVEAAARALWENTDLIRGATDFFDPKTQDSGYQLGRKLNMTAVQYIESRARMGLQWIGPVEGIDERRQMFFVHVGAGADPSAAIAAIQRESSVSDVLADLVEDNGDGSGALILLLVGLALFGGVA